MSKPLDDIELLGLIFGIIFEHLFIHLFVHLKKNKKIEIEPLMYILI